MNVLGFIASSAHVWLRASEEVHVDNDGQVITHSSIWPETAEIIYGGIASLLIFGMLIKFAGPAIRKGMAARTARIQSELDGAAKAKADAAAEAAQIRQAKGDVNAERQRILAEAEAQAAAIREDGRARLAAELADTEAKGQADIAALGTRVNDELRAEITRLSNAAVDHVVTGSLDDSVHQELIESFINRLEAIK